MAIQPSAEIGLPPGMPARGGGYSGGNGSYGGGFASSPRVSIPPAQQLPGRSNIVPFRPSPPPSPTPPAPNFPAPPGRPSIPAPTSPNPFSPGEVFPNPLFPGVGSAISSALSGLFSSPPPSGSVSSSTVLGPAPPNPNRFIPGYYQLALYRSVSLERDVPGQIVEIYYNPPLLTPLYYPGLVPVTGYQISPADIFVTIADPSGRTLEALFPHLIGYDIALQFNPNPPSNQAGSAAPTAPPPERTPAPPAPATPDTPPPPLPTIPPGDPYITPFRRRPQPNTPPEPERPPQREPEPSPDPGPDPEPEPPQPEQPPSDPNPPPEPEPTPPPAPDPAPVNPPPTPNPTPSPNGTPPPQESPPVEPDRSTPTPAPIFLPPLFPAPLPTPSPAPIPAPTPTPTPTPTPPPSPTPDTPPNPQPTPPPSPSQPPAQPQPLTPAQPGQPETPPNPQPPATPAQPQPPVQPAPIGNPDPGDIQEWTPYNDPAVIPGTSSIPFGIGGNFPPGATPVSPVTPPLPIPSAPGYTPTPPNPIPIPPAAPAPVTPLTPVNGPVAAIPPATTPIVPTVVPQIPAAAKPVFQPGTAPSPIVPVTPPGPIDPCNPGNADPCTININSKATEAAANAASANAAAQGAANALMLVPTAFKQFDKCNDGVAEYKTNIIAVPRNMIFMAQSLFEELAFVRGEFCKQQTAIATVPEWWQVRPEATRPQAILVFKEVKPDGTIGKDPYSITIPHCTLTEAPAAAPLTTYKKGIYQGILTLKDNSKLIVNCKDIEECERVITALSAVITSGQLEGSTTKIGKTKGIAFKQIQVKAQRLDYFPEGVKNMRPVYMKSFF